MPRPPKRSHSTWVRVGEWDAFRGSELPEDGDLCPGAGARHAGVAAGAESGLCGWLLLRRSAGGRGTVLVGVRLYPRIFSRNTCTPPLAPEKALDWVCAC